MIHYHGTPITPHRTMMGMRGKHFFVSFYTNNTVSVVAEIGQSFAIDNGAFSAWTKGVKVDWNEYKDFIHEWERHPSYDWHVIPDVIDGDERTNDKMIENWGDMKHGVPVWHLHESLERLESLVNSFDRIALGSSGEFSEIGDFNWWSRINEAMKVVCDEKGRPKTRIHGMRMLDNRLRKIPFASADSTNLAQNLSDAQLTREARAFILADRIELEQSAPTWKYEKAFDNEVLGAFLGENK